MTESDGRVLLCGGQVYSPADPFASAMLVDGGLVAWIGSEGAALAQADGVDHLIDLDGALVTPAFVDAHVHATATGLMLSGLDPAGVQAALVNISPDQRRDAQRTTRTRAAELGIGTLHDFAGQPPAALETAEAVAVHTISCVCKEIQPGFQVVSDGLDPVLEGLRAAAAAVGLPALRSARPRLELTGSLCTEQIAALVELGVVASVQPVLAGSPYASLAAAGVALAFGSGSPATPLGPWEAVRAAAFHRDPTQRISVRAAFAAHTRGGWRAARIDDAGVLVPGAPATYVIWAASELVVQAPDGRVAAWSTDPRSGTPGLPDLTPGTPVPMCLRTVVAGQTVYDNPPHFADHDPMQPTGLREDH